MCSRYLHYQQKYVNVCVSEKPFTNYIPGLGIQEEKEYKVDSRQPHLYISSEYLWNVGTEPFSLISLLWRGGLRVGYGNSGVAIASRFDRIEIGQDKKTNPKKTFTYLWNAGRDPPPPAESAGREATLGASPCFVAGWWADRRAETST